MQGFIDREYVVWRRFSDFLGLHEKLMDKYFYKGYLVPAAPEKSIAALTRTKMNASADDNTNKLVDFGVKYMRYGVLILAFLPLFVVNSLNAELEVFRDSAGA